MKSSSTGHSERINVTSTKDSDGKVSRTNIQTSKLSSTLSQRSPTNNITPTYLPTTSADILPKSKKTSPAHSPIQINSFSLANTSSNNYHHHQFNALSLGENSAVSTTTAKPIYIEKVNPSPLAPIEDIVINSQSVVRSVTQSIHGHKTIGEARLSVSNPLKLDSMDPQISSIVSSNPNTISKFPISPNTIKLNSVSFTGISPQYNSNDRSHQFPSTDPLVSSSNPQKPLLPSEFQYPVYKEPYSNTFSNILKHKNIESSDVSAFADVIENAAITSDNDEIEREIMPVLNGQSTSYQVPSYYQPPNTAKAKSRPILSSKEINILLLHVARLGDIHALRSILRSPRLDINLVDDEGRSCLMFAAIGGHEECVDVLIEKGAVVHQADYSGRTPLHWAAQFGRVAVIQKLLKAGAEVMSDDYQGKTSLHCAVGSTNPTSIHVLLKHLRSQSDVDCKDDDNMSPLMWASYHGNTQAVMALLKHKANPLLKDVEGKTALHWTVSNKHSQCVAILVNSCPELLISRDKYGRIPLHLACGEGNISVVYLLLSVDPMIVNERDELQRTALHWASICGKSAILKLLCEFGVRLNKKDKYGATAIYYAAQQNFQDCVHVLIRKGSSVSCQDEFGRQPLVWAAVQGHIEVIKMLLLAKADVNAREDHGLSALHFAAYAGHTACCLYLIRNGAVVDSVDYKSHTPLFRATISCHSETVLALISEGADVSAKDLAGRTPLHWSSSCGHIDVVNILVGYGASISARDTKGATPLHEASFNGKTDVMVYLLSRGADVNVRDDNGVTPVHWAAVNGHVNCCRLLISNGADVNAMVFDVDRDTPLDYAYLNNNFECAQFIIDHGGLMAEDIISRAVIKIQLFWRKHAEARKLCFNRGKKSESSSINPHTEEPREAHHAATVIQKIWRGYKDRKNYSKLLEEASLADSNVAVMLAMRSFLGSPQTVVTPITTNVPANFTTSSSSNSGPFTATHSSGNHTDPPTSSLEFKPRLSSAVESTSLTVNTSHNPPSSPLLFNSDTPDSPTPPILTILPILREDKKE